MRRLAVALSLLLITTATAAQTAAPERDGGVVSGVVTTVSGALITILDGWVTIDASEASITSRKGTATLSDVKPGQRVTASLAPGTLRAVRLLILDEPDGLMSGRIDSVDLSRQTITLLGTTVTVTPDTRIGGLVPPREASLGELKAGDQVVVTLRSSTSGLVAEHILIQPPPIHGTTVSGTVKSIAADQWVITDRDGKDIVVLVTTQTRIDGSLKVGDVAQVVGTLDPAGNTVALAIFALRPLPTPILIEGNVQSIGRESWTIATRDGQVTVIVNDKTRIEGSPKVGMSVRVLATREESGAIVALHIAPAAPLPTPVATRFEGVVRAMSPREWAVDSVRVFVTPLTRIIGSPAVGDTVIVTGSRGPDGVFVALSIEKKQPRGSSR